MLGVILTIQRGICSSLMRAKRLSKRLKKRGRSKQYLCNFCSVERDAQLLANRIALLKQEEMKTWKKIEETKKRSKEVHNLKQKNEDRMRRKMEQMQMEEMIR